MIRLDPLVIANRDRPYCTKFLLKEINTLKATQIKIKSENCGRKLFLINCRLNMKIFIPQIYPVQIFHHVPDII